jgi:hypothetical protein
MVSLGRVIVMLLHIILLVGRGGEEIEHLERSGRDKNIKIDKNTVKVASSLLLY